MVEELIIQVSTPCMDVEFFLPHCVILTHGTSCNVASNEVCMGASLIDAIAEFSVAAMCITS